MNLENGHRGMKWNVRYFECLLSMAMANSYQVMRALRGADPISHTEFQVQLYTELYNNILPKKCCSGPQEIMTTRRWSSFADSTTHSLAKTPPGSAIEQVVAIVVPQKSLIPLKGRREKE